MDNRTELKKNKWSKNFDKRPHRRGAFFTGAMSCYTDQSGALQSAAAVPLSCRYWRLYDWCQVATKELATEPDRNGIFGISWGQKHLWWQRIWFFLWCISLHKQPPL